MCVFAYGIALIVYQLGGLLLGEVAFNFFTVFALVLLAGLVYLLVRKGEGIKDETIDPKGFSWESVH